MTTFPIDHIINAEDGLDVRNKLNNVIDTTNILATSTASGVLTLSSDSGTNVSRTTGLSVQFLQADGAPIPLTTVGFFYQLTDQDPYKLLLLGTTDSTGFFNGTITLPSTASTAKIAAMTKESVSNIITLVIAVTPDMPANQSFTTTASPGNGTSLGVFSAQNSIIGATYSFTGDTAGLSINANTAEITVTNSPSFTAGTKNINVICTYQGTQYITALVITVQAAAFGYQDPTIIPQIYTYKNQGLPSSWTSIEKTLGFKMNYILDFGNRGGGVTAFFTNIKNEILDHWVNQGRKLVISVSLPDGGLAPCAAGNYDANWRDIGNHAVANGFADTTWRLFWEFNGGWFSQHSPQWNQGNVFGNAFRKASIALKSVPGNSFKVMYCPNIDFGGIDGMKSYTAADGTGAYPGDDVIDIVGIDGYGQSYSNSRITPSARINAMIGNGFDYQFQAWYNFAKAHGRQFWFAEIGSGFKPDGFGGGDIVEFWNAIKTFCTTNNVPMMGFFDIDAGDYQSQWTSAKNVTGVFPQIAANPANGYNTPLDAPARNALRNAWSFMHNFGNIAVKGDLSTADFETIAPSAITLTPQNGCDPLVDQTIPHDVYIPNTIKGGQVVVNVSGANHTAQRVWYTDQGASQGGSTGTTFGNYGNRGLGFDIGPKYKEADSSNIMTGMFAYYTASNPTPKGYGGQLKMGGTYAGKKATGQVWISANNGVGGVGKMIKVLVQGTPPIYGTDVNVNVVDTPPLGSLLFTAKPTNTPSPAAVLSLSGPAAGAVTVNQTTGAVTITDPSFFTHASNPTTNVTVTATNSEGTADIVANVTVYDVGVTPPPINSAAPVRSGALQPFTNLITGATGSFKAAPWTVTGFDGNSSTNNILAEDGNATAHNIKQNYLAHTGQQYDCEMWLSPPPTNPATYIHMASWGASSAIQNYAVWTYPGNSPNQQQSSGLIGKSTTDLGNSVYRKKFTTAVMPSDATIPFYISGCTSEFMYNPTLTYGGTFGGKKIGIQWAAVWGNGVAYATTGSWIVAPGSPGVPAYTYQWQTSTDNITFSNIGGATNSFYIILAADIGNFIRCQVIGTTDGGASDPVYTTAGLITGLVPFMKTLPTMAGTFSSGSTITATEGTYYASPTVTPGGATIKWYQVTGTSGSMVYTLAQTGGTTFAIPASGNGPSGSLWAGSRLCVEYTASNSAGAATRPARSNVSAVIT